MKSFRSRILLLVLGLVALPLGATIYALARKAESAAEAQAAVELRAGATIARETLVFHGEQLSFAVRVLTADFGLKEAIASADHATLLSALDNHGARVHAALVAAFDIEGNLLATTADHPTAQSLAQLRESAINAGTAAHAISYRIIDGMPYELVAATVRAPEPIACVVMGFALNEALAKDIARVVGVDVSFVARDFAQRQSVASSATQPAIDLLAELTTSLNGNAAHSTRLNSQHFLVQRETLLSADGTLLLILHEPLGTTTQTYAELQSAILLIGGSALLFALLLGSWLTQAATRPITTLTAAAARIERGDYAAIEPMSNAREFTQLSAAFASMRDAVAEREQRILHQSQHDELTGLMNRTALRQALSVCIAQHSAAGQAIALCVLELVQLADINAALGHSVGDRLLRTVARRIRTKAPGIATVARGGSTHFLIMSPNCAADAALLLGQELLHEVQLPLAAADIPIRLNARCGLALFPTHGLTAEDLLRRTDLALLQAQQTEASIAIFNPDTEASHQRRIQVLGDLQRGIEANQLSLVYQPKMDLRTRAIVSCEVLVRWQHPVHGNVPPAEFIPHAERTGSIRQLTTWVLTTALAQLAAWNRAGKHIELAVNLSAVDVADGYLPQEITALLQQHQVPGEQLILEITESTVMRTIDTVLNAMNRLRGNGIRFSIDDFGTGYSSLAQLRRLPVDELKLEGSLIADLAQEERARMIVRAMTELGHSLGMRVVAEGVETVQLLRAVAKCGCDIAQGYLIAKPMDAAQLLPWLDQQSLDTLSLDSTANMGLTARVRTLSSNSK